jgi:ribosome-associated translation inhibitor RaiA
MQLPLQITYRDLPHSEALDTRIREKAAKLEEFHHHIISCRVTVEEQQRHSLRGNQFCVRLDIKVPQHEIAITRDHHEDVYVALRDAFAAAYRKLEDTVRMQRRQVKVHDATVSGVVARLFPQERYGFIQGPQGNEYYFSPENVVEPSFEQLEVGMTVQFIEGVADEGRQAKRISCGRRGAAGAAAQEASL